MKDYWHQRDEINKLFNAPRHTGLKYTSLIIIGLVIAAQIATVIWWDLYPHRFILIIQGCIGIGAIVFVILVAILTYRVYSEYHK